MIAIFFSFLIDRFNYWVGEIWDTTDSNGIVSVGLFWRISLRSIWPVLILICRVVVLASCRFQEMAIFWRENRGCFSLLVRRPWRCCLLFWCQSHRLLLLRRRLRQAYIDRSFFGHLTALSVVDVRIWLSLGIPFRVGSICDGWTCRHFVPSPFSAICQICALATSCPIVALRAIHCLWWCVEQKQMVFFVWNFK